jgi:hypothetical protein
MNEQDFERDFTLVDNWVNSMRPHWAHLNGDVHNDKDFWQQCIHTVRPEVWAAWTNLFHTLEESMPGAFVGHTYIADDTEEIHVRICGNKRMTIPYNKTGYNKPIFRATMAIKDIIAEITERPFIIKAPEPVKPHKPTKQQVLAQLDIARIMIEELFD